VDPKKLQERLMAGFLVELDEHVGSLNRELLALEKGGTVQNARPHVDALFRAAHTLKSASRAMGLTVLEVAAHRLEGVMSAVRSGRLPLSPMLFEVLYAEADRFHEAGVELRTGRGLAATFFDEVTGRMEAAAADGATPGGGEAPAKAADGPGAAGVRGQPPAPASEQGPGTTVASSQPPAPASEQGPGTTVASGQPPAPASEQGADGAELARTIRVDAGRLDDLLSLSRELGQRAARLGAWLADLGELQGLADRLDRDWRAGRGMKGLAGRSTSPGTAAPNRLLEGIRSLRSGLSRTRAALKADVDSARLVVEQLEEDLQQLRMLPFHLACAGLDRTVRDLGKAFGREVDLEISGKDVEMDRAVLEGLKDPLVHLVRNAVGHGIEPPAVRSASKKRARGTIRVAASLQRGQVEVVVEDDGRGIDRGGVRKEAERQGLQVADDSDSLLRLLLLPGFTTARETTEVSGRGVGLDVVRTRVEEMQGTVQLSSEEGRGTTVSLTVPLTLTTVSALLVSEQGVCYAIPSSQVQRLIRASADEIRQTGPRSVLMLEGRPLSVAPLCGLLDRGSTRTWTPGERLSGVVLSVQGKEAVLLVDQLLETREILVRPLSPRLGRIPHLSGATTLPDGRMALILYPSGLLEAIGGAAPGGAWLRREDRQAARARSRLLLVDDSLTTRSLEKMILESAGYHVAVAADGLEAWDLLQRMDFALVVSDIQMPRMDGVALTTAIRGSGRHAELPVVLVTGLDSEEDRTRGLEAGADAYIVKSAFDQGQLLETIARLL